MSDPQTDNVLGGHAAQRLAIELDISGGADHVADRAQRRGLAGTVGAEQRGDAAFVEREFEAVKGLDLAVIGAQILDRQHRAHWSLLPR
jgi:predicted short-subunit dehydrogenase-like oxidoreductase (DUF2520 family)